MRFDRTRIKEEAKARIRLAAPHPWKVTLAYFGLALLVPLFLFFCFVMALSLSPLRKFIDSPAASPLVVLIYLVLLIPMILLQAGYCSYSIKIWRREPSSYKDLLYGFSNAPRFLALWGLLFLLAFFWALPFLAAAPLSAFLLRSDLPLVLQYILASLLPLAAYALTISRMLLYTLSLHILADHPDYTARQALQESKALMLGQRWNLVLFFLSFLGWYLLEYIIVYGATLIGGISFFLVLYSTSSEPVIALSLLLFVLFLLCSMIPLLLWLAPYMSVSLSGIYDCLRGVPLIPPLPPESQ